MSEEVDIEELLRRGGKVEDAPGVITSAMRGAKQWVTRGYGDEISGAAGAVGHVIGRGLRRAMDGKPIPTSLDEIGQELEGIRGAYRKARDDIRFEDDRAEEANPTVFNGVGVAGDLALGVVTGGASLGLKGAAALGAVEGGVGALGNSRADLTDGDVYQYAQAFEDTATGAGLGAAGGAAGYGVGKGVQKVGRWARGELDTARDTLWQQEARKGNQDWIAGEEKEIARRELQRDLEGKAARELEQQHGQGLEANKKVNQRAAREADRFSGQRTQADRQLQGAMEAQDAAEREAGQAARRPRGAPPGLAEEPGTKTLGGYQGSAGERRAVNYDRVKAYRQDLAQPDLPAAERQRLERYVDSYGDAVDNPGAFERLHIEQELRKRYPRQVVDRIMAERVGPNGEIIPRPTARGGTPSGEPSAPRGAADQPSGFHLPELEELTNPGDMFDAAARGEARAGGGGSAFDFWPEEARTVVDPDMAPVRPRETFSPLPRRRPEAGSPAFDVGGQPPPEFSKAGTRAGDAASEAEDLVRQAEEAMAMRRAGAAEAQAGVGARQPSDASAVIADAKGRFPEAFEGPGPGPRTISRLVRDAEDLNHGRAPEPPMAAPVDQPLPPAPPPAQPASQSATAPQSFETLRSPAMERVAARERGAGGQVLRSGWEGVKSSNNVLGAVLGGMKGVGAEVLRDPAVKARVLSALRLAKLEQANPRVFARVGRAMVQALASGDADSMSAYEHVQLQTDPEFRVAHQQAEAATQDLSDEELLAELEAAGVL